MIFIEFAVRFAINMILYAIFKVPFTFLTIAIAVVICGLFILVPMWVKGH